MLAGGGINHRHNLSDMILIKENHLQPFQTTQQITALTTRLEKFIKDNPNIKLCCEIETCAQLETLPIHLMDILLLDNFSLTALQQAIRIIKTKNIKAEIEVSGGINLTSIQNYKGIAINRISIGAITHSVKALDLSLLIKGVHS